MVRNHCKPIHHSAQVNSFASMLYQRCVLNEIFTQRYPQDEIDNFTLQAPHAKSVTALVKERCVYYRHGQ